MKTKKCLIFLIATICLAVSMTSCGQVSDDDMTANCVENFFDAINEGDVDEALTYVDSRSQKIGGMAISLIDSFIDTELIGGIGISDIMGVSMALGTNGNMFIVDDIDASIFICHAFCIFILSSGFKFIAVTNISPKSSSLVISFISIYSFTIGVYTL